MELQLVAPSKLTESPTNPRRFFDKAELAALTADVAVHGVLQPLVARKVGKELELIFGHRRLRAALGAGLAEVPVLVREASDAEALELQLVENLKRSDLSALEVAEGYQALHKTHGLDVDAIAKAVGRSRSSVYQALKLTELVAPAKKALGEGKLSPSVGVLVARLPAALQPKALEEVLQGRYGDSGPMTHATAVRWMADNYMVDLRKAPFDTGSLELVPAAGDCVGCPKRSGNAKELYPDAAGADVCTSPECYQAKVAAHARALAAKKGVPLLEGKAAEEATSYGSSDYVRAEARHSRDKKYRTYAELLGKKAAAPLEVMALDKQGEVVTLLKREGLEAAVKAVGKLEKSASSGGDAKADAERKRREKAAAAAWEGVLQAVAKKGLTLELLKVAAIDIGSSVHEHFIGTGEKYSPYDAAAEKAWTKWVGEAKRQQLEAVLLHHALGDAATETWSGYSDALKDCVAELGLKLSTFESQVAAPAPAEKPKGKKGKAA